MAITISVMPMIEKIARGAKDQRRYGETLKVVLISYSRRTVQIPKAIKDPPCI